MRASSRAVLLFGVGVRVEVTRAGFFPRVGVGYPRPLSACVSGFLSSVTEEQPLSLSASLREYNARPPWAEPPETINNNTSFPS